MEVPGTGKGTTMIFSSIKKKVRIDKFPQRIEERPCSPVLWAIEATVRMELLAPQAFMLARARLGTQSLLLTRDHVLWVN